MGDVSQSVECEKNDIKEQTVFLLSDTILVRGLRTSVLVDSAIINLKGTKRGLGKLESIINMKNFRRSEILSDNLRDEVGDHSDNLIENTEKVYQTHTNLVINKHNIVAMT